MKFPSRFLSKTLWVLVLTSQAALALEPHPTPETASRYGKHPGLLGPVTVGPVATAIGAPSPFRVGIEAKYEDLAALVADYGFLPSLSLGDYGVKYNSWRITGRFHPFRGAFYVGVGFGHQSFTGTLTRNESVAAIFTGPVTYQIDIDATLLVPQVGWQWEWESGFFLGMELGVQIPLSPTATASSNAPATFQQTPQYKSGQADVEDKGKTYGKTPLPHVALLQAGFLF